MKKVFWIISVLFVFVNIFGVLLYFSFNLDFYKQQFTSIELTESRILNVKNVYDFIQNKSELNSSFNTEESSHLEDVKNIFSVVIVSFWILLLLLVITLIYCLFLSKHNSIVIDWIFLWSTISLILMLLLFLAIVVNFGSSFDVFHKLLFPQGNWTFSADSQLIILFPESFFVSISKSIFLSISIISVFFMSISMLLKRTLK